MRFLLSVLIFILSFSSACAVDSSSVFNNENISLPEFSYGGEKFDAKKWKIERIPVLQNSEVAEERLTLTSPDGLIRITQNIFEYKKFGVTEWKTRIENIGKEKSKIVEDYKVLAMEAKNAPQKTKLDGVNIRRLKDSDTLYSDFCPDDFFLERRLALKLCLWKTRSDIRPPNGCRMSDWISTT